MGKLEKKVAVITGAASGIGRATAIRFAGEDAAVVIADLNRGGGEAAVRDCKENGGSAVFQLTDVASEEDIKSAVYRAVKEFGHLDIIYNNAGLGGAVGPLEKTSAENWDRSFSILLRAVFLGIKHAVPEMRKTGSGSIISTASIEQAATQLFAAFQIADGLLVSGRKLGCRPLAPSRPRPTRQNLHVKLGASSSRSSSS